MCGAIILSSSYYQTTTQVNGKVGNLIHAPRPDRFRGLSGRGDHMRIPISDLYIRTVSKSL